MTDETLVCARCGEPVDPVMPRFHDDPAEDDDHLAVPVSLREWRARLAA